MNDDLLVLQYPAFENKINEARKFGYSDDEIGGSISSRRQLALAHGYTEDEIDKKLGVTDESRFAYLNAAIKRSQETAGLLYNKSPEQMESLFKENRNKGIDLNKTIRMAGLSSLSSEESVNKYLTSMAAYKFKEADLDRGPRFEWNRELNDFVGAVSKNIYLRTVGGITVGVLSSAEGMLRGGAFLSEVVGYEDGYKKASQFADFLEGGTEEYSGMLYKDRDVNLMDAVMQGIGSNGMFFFAGVAAAKLIGYVGGAALLAGAKLPMVERLARYAGASIQATTESLSEAGGVYKEVLDRTGDKAAATSAASCTFWFNMPSNFLSDKFAFWGEDSYLKRVLPKVARSARMQSVLYIGAKAAAGFASEGAQETFQGAVSEHYGNGSDWTALDLSEIAFQQGLPGGIVGAIMGSATSLRFQAMVAEEQAKSAEEQRLRHLKEVSGVVHNVKEQLLQSGRDEETANAESAVWGARASNGAKQQGISPMEWYEKQGLSVRITDFATGDYNQTMKADVPDDGKYLLWDEKISKDQAQVLFEALAKSDDFDGPVAKWIRSERMNNSSVTDNVSEEDVADEHYSPDVLREHVETYADFYGASGEHVYDQLNDIFGSPRAASLWLKEHGVAGIKYLDGNSRGMGEGNYNYVVFDDQDSKALETFYQNKAKSKEIYEDDKYLYVTNSSVDLNSEVAGIALQPMSTNDDVQRAKIKRTIPLALKKLVGSYTNDDTGWDVNLSKGGLRHFISDALNSNVVDANHGLDIVRSLPYILKYARLVKSHEDYYHSPGITQVHRFLAPVMFGEKDAAKMYSVLLTVKEMDGKFEAEVDGIYKAHALDAIKEIPDAKPKSKVRYDESPSWNTPGTFTTMLSNVVQPVNEKLLNSHRMAQDFSASVLFEDGKSIVSLFRESNNKSSFLHESGHVFLNDLANFINSGKTTEEDVADWNTLLEWLGVEDWNSMTPEQRAKAHEQFARGTEAYFWEGVSPSKSLTRLFHKFSQWLREIYDSISALDVEISPEVNKVFDRMFGVDDEVGDVVTRNLTDSMLKEDIAKETEGAALKGKEDIPEEQTALDDSGDMSYENTWTDDDIAAYEAERERSRLAVQGSFDPAYEPAMWDVTEEGVNEQIDKMEFAEEEDFHKQTAYDEFVEFGRQIREKGGLLYKSLVNTVGAEKAKELYRKAPALFSKTTVLEIAEVASDLGISVGDIINRIDSRPSRPVHERFLPIVSVDAWSLPWIKKRMGSNGSILYLNKRLRYVESQQLEAEKDYEAAKAEEKAQEMESIKAEYKRLSFEADTIKRGLKELSGQVEADADASLPELSWPEFSSKARDQAVRWTQITVKDAINKISGKTKISELVSENEAMKAAFGMAETESRRAFRNGKTEGMLIAAAKYEALQKKKLDRAETRRYIMRLVKGIDTATAGNLIFSKKREIMKLLEDFDLQFRTKKTIANRKTISDFIREGVDEAKKTGEAMSMEFMDFAQQELRILNRLTLNNMSLDDLIGLHTKVTALRRDGVKEYLSWEAKNRQELDLMKRPLLDTMGGPKRSDDSGIVIPGKTKRGKEIKPISAALLHTLTPSYIFDTLDDYADFKGAFHSLFMRRADDAETSFLRAKAKRLKAMEDIFKIYGMTGEKLHEARLKFVNPTNEEETILTLDHCLHIYIGWHNQLTRDALMYGNNISQTVADGAAAALSDNEKDFAMAVMNEQGGENTDRYENVLLDTFNIGLNREKYYTRMYRTQWTDSKGEAVDEGIKGFLDSLAMEYGIRKLYADKGSSYNRKTIGDLFQEPISLGLVSVWNRSMVEHEHLIAYGKLVRQLHSIVNEKTDLTKPVPVAGVKETIENTYGKDVQRWMVEYINRLANPDFYKSFKATDQMMRKVRANVGVAYLWGNIASFMKQPQAIAYYLRDAGITHLVSSVAEFTAHPVRTMERVWELDPQVKDQKINRFLEEVKATQDDGYLGNIKKYGEWGFAPMEWTDMMTRCIGWNAVYKNELAKGSSEQDAAYAAQRATLNTQNAVHPKELPAYMATGNEMLNLMTQFTNQSNKIFGVTVHTLYGDFKNGRYHKGFLTMLSLFIGAYLMTWLKNGEGPTDSKDAFKKLFVEETLGNIPLMGSGFQAYASGFSGGATPYDDVATDLAKALFKSFDGEFEDSAMALYTAWSILIGGTPVTVVKRAIKYAETGDLSDLTGLMRKQQRKRMIVP